jgi:hypothetical protein
MSPPKLSAARLYVDWGVFLNCVKWNLLEKEKRPTETFCVQLLIKESILIKITQNQKLQIKSSPEKTPVSKRSSLFA